MSHTFPSETYWDSTLVVSFDAEFENTAFGTWPWDIGCCLVADGACTFQRTVQPPTLTFAHREKPFTTLSPSMLQREHAVPLHDAVRDMCAWCDAQRRRLNKSTVTMAAHGARTSDQPIMRRCLRMVGVPKLPSSVFWWDTLPFTRFAWPASPRFSMEALVQHAVDGTFVQEHRALPDAVALAALLRQCPVPFSGLAIALHLTPLPVHAKVNAYIQDATGCPPCVEALVTLNASRRPWPSFFAARLPALRQPALRRIIKVLPR